MNASVGRGTVSAIGGLVIAVALHAIDPSGGVRAQTPAPGAGIEVVQVRPNVWMLAGAGGNIVVHLGWMGAVVVDTGSADMSNRVLTEIQRITDSRIRFINTGADPEHVGGNAALARAGRTLLRYAPNVGNFGGSDFQTNSGAAGIMAHENVLTRMSAGGKTAYPATAWPTEAFTGARVRSLYLNGDGVQMFYQPAAHSDADTIVFFRRADVVVAGDILDLRHFPIIDLENGGSIDGEIAALNRLIDLTVPPAPLVWHEDPVTGDVLAWRVSAGGSDRAPITIWMDGRPHPSAQAVHSFSGFTTGEWVGDRLTARMTHMKRGILRRNGVPLSDRATLTLHFVRHGDVLTIMGVTNDPIYLEQPLVQSGSYRLNPRGNAPATNPTCFPFTELAQLDKPGSVPHFLPGTNPDADTFAKMYNLPLDAAHGGAETIYPEFRKKLRERYTPPAACTRYCCGWGGGNPAASGLKCIVGGQ